MKLTLFHKKTIWLPTWRASVLIGVMIAVLIFVFLQSIHPFLAVTQRAPANILVVGGWLSDEAMAAAIAEFSQGEYDCLISTGGPIQTGRYFAKYDDYASLGASVLDSLGFQDERLRVVPVPCVKRNRTFAEATSVRNRLEREGITIDGINTITEGVHARRTRLVYARVFSDAPVGVIALAPGQYDASSWWRYSAGLVAVLNETIRLTYEWLLGSGRSESDGETAAAPANGPRPKACSIANVQHSDSGSCRPME